MLLWWGTTGDDARAALGWGRVGARVVRAGVHVSRVFAVLGSVGAGLAGWGARAWRVLTRRSAAAAPAERKRARRPGNVVLRRRRLQSEVFSVRRSRRLIRFRPTPWYLVGAFGSVILLGMLLLALPISSESRSWTSGVDSLFTAMSAVSVTGLVRFDTAEHWSGFGEVVILGLIQLGGLGVTIYAGSLLLLLGRRLGLRGHNLFGMELSGAGDWDIGRLLRRVAVFVVVAESVTFLLLVPWFVAEFDGARAVWSALFHSVSAFNNAGFDLMGGGTGMQGQVEAEYPIIVMGVAAFVGSLSFVTVFDVPRGWRRWSLDTRFVLITMFGLLGVGMLVFLIGEVQGGRLLDGRGALESVSNAFFLSVNRTTGMSTVDMGQAQDATVAMLLPMMFIGGASTSVAGGIKVGAFVVGLAVVWSSLRGRHQAEIFSREIPHAVVLRATAVVMLAVAVFAAGVVAVEITEDVPFLPLTFEVMSALANVGWSQGVTGGLTEGGAVVLAVLMFLGRLGTMMVALTVPDRPQSRYHYSREGVRIG